jgi:hypothetical protein
MKLMEYVTSKNEVKFHLDEPEMKFDDIDYELIVEGKPIAKSRVGSEWTLRFKITEPMKPGSAFIVKGQSPMKGEVVLATGFSHGTFLVCHQALSKRI